MNLQGTDVAVVGAGIVGLAHAYEAAQRGKRVRVFEREARAIGASIQNFGFLTVTGQSAGECWRLALENVECWQQIAASAKIPVLQNGLLVCTRRPESSQVLDTFLETDMGRDCRRLTVYEAQKYIPSINAKTVDDVLYSPYERRVESRQAIPKLTAWLAERFGVEFHWRTEVYAVEDDKLETSAGRFLADRIIVCPGDNFTGPAAAMLDGLSLSRCKLQMMRLQPSNRQRFDCVLMSDLGLLRYPGYAQMPVTSALYRRIAQEQQAQLNHGIHLIVVQSADGSLIVGDSHVNADSHDPFVSDRINRLILDEMEQVVSLGDYRVVENWCGTYAVGGDHWYVRRRPSPNQRLVVVTAGCGASTAIGLAKQTFSEMD